MFGGHVKPLHLLVLALSACTLATFIAATEPENARPDSSAVLPLSLGVADIRRPHTTSDANPRGLSTSTPTDNTAWQLAELTRYSRISKDWLARQGFLTNEDALAKLARLLDGHTDAGPSKGYALTMAPGPNAAQIPDLEISRISDGERYVQANLPNSAISGLDSVVIRWRNLDNALVQELSVQPVSINTAAISVPIWMYRQEGWPIGNYMVEVLSGNVGLQLVATGKFAIVSHSEPVTQQAYLLAKEVAP